MATPRSPGGSPSIRRPSSQTSPESALSSPAMMRSKVDLPDPEGPRNAMNSRASSVRLTSSSTGVAPKLFRTPLSCRLATRLSRSVYNSTEAAACRNKLSAGWGGRIRTCECRYQKPVPYHLATPQQAVRICGKAALIPARRAVGSGYSLRSGAGGALGQSRFGLELRQLGLEQRDIGGNRRRLVL